MTFIIYSCHILFYLNIVVITLKCIWERKCIVLCRHCAHQWTVFNSFNVNVAMTKEFLYAIYKCVCVDCFFFIAFHFIFLVYCDENAITMWRVVDLTWNCCNCNIYDLKKMKYEILFLLSSIKYLFWYAIFFDYS